MHINLKGSMHTQTEICDALVASSPRLQSLIKRRPTTHQLRSANEKAFNAVTHELEESLGCRDSGHNVGRANTTDFRSDCALAAKSVLSPRDRILWANSYLDFTVPAAKIPAAIATHIRSTVGREYLRRGLNNTGGYFSKGQS
jgi:hypothetical protein